jgi:hypothetical protein
MMIIIMEVVKSRLVLKTLALVLSPAILPKLFTKFVSTDAGAMFSFTILKVANLLPN